MSTLADEIRGRTPAIAIHDSPRRVHRIDDDEEEKPTVPRKRKAAGPTIEEARDKAEARTTRKKRKYTKRAPDHSPSRTAGASFSVNDLGCVSIVAGDSRVDLTLPDTKRLAGFIDRSKALRG